MRGLSGISYGVGLLATLSYCAATWYAGNLFAVLAGLEAGVPVSNFSLVAIAPLDLNLAFNMIHWQLLALASFAFSVVLAFRKSTPGENHALAALPLVIHYGVLLLLILFHLVGFLLPMVPDCATIS